jgi:hypothetical protein
MALVFQTETNEVWFFHLVLLERFFVCGIRQKGNGRSMMDGTD